MNFVLERVSEPAIEVVTLAEMIQQVREFSTIPAATQDELTRLIAVAREWAEHYTGRIMVDQQWRLTIGDYVNRYANVDSDTVTGYYTGVTRPTLDGAILLRKSPVLAITSINSVDADGVETLIAADTYQLREADFRWPTVVRLSGTTWATGTYRILFRAGFADQTSSPTTGAEVVPQRFKQAIRLYAEAHYTKEEKRMGMLIEAAEKLIRPESSDLSLA